MAKTVSGKITLGVNKKRRNIHAKTKHSSHKNSKHYQKMYRGQGR